LSFKTRIVIFDVVIVHLKDCFASLAMTEYIIKTSNQQQVTRNQNGSIHTYHKKADPEDR